MISRAKAHQLRAMIEKASVSLDDSDALDAVELFPVWQVGVDYTEGRRVRDDMELFKCRQPHTSQADWRPSVTPALWTKVAKPGQGDTPDDPIPWSWGLEIFSGKNNPPRPNYPEALGLRHLAFRVADVEIAARELAAKGIEAEPIRSDPIGGGRMTFFKDPDGLPLELHD